LLQVQKANYRKPIDNLNSQNAELTERFLWVFFCPG
jgi:hypothetical protein